MSNSFRKLIGIPVKRRRATSSDGTGFALTSAAMRLLSNRDYDSVSMVKLAKAASCSVGAVYGRFGSKNAFLYRMLASTIHQMRDNTVADLGLEYWPRASTESTVRYIVEKTVANMTGDVSAISIRTVAKFMTVMPTAARFMEEYRDAVTDTAIERLCGGSDGPSPRHVRSGMQMVFATVTDAIIHPNPGPMRAGGARMVDCLSNMLIGYLRLGGSTIIDNDEDDDDPPKEEPGSEEPPELGPDEIAVYNLDTRRFHGKVRTASKGGRRVTPKKKVPAPSSEAKPRSANYVGGDNKVLATTQLRPTPDSTQAQKKATRKGIRLL